MLTRALAGLAGALMLSLALLTPQAAADDNPSCPPGTDPVHVGSGVICIVVSDPGAPSQPGDPGDLGDSGENSQVPTGCFKSDGTKVACETADGYWWSAYQCYASPYDAQPGAPAWQGHTDGSLWQCSACTASGSTGTCSVQIIWVGPGEEPAPPSPEQLAASAFGLMQLAEADLQTAPQPPAATYIGVETWLWVPDAQWATLSKSVSAGATTVTVTASPTDVMWDLGVGSLTCEGPGVPWVRGMTDAASTSCGYVYETSSDRQTNGLFPIAATIRYAVTWSCAGTCPTTGGNFGLVDAPAGVSSMRVLQRQSVVVR